MKARNVLFTVALTVILSAFSLQAAPPLRITAQKVITEPGSYILANDIAASGVGIDIRSSDVTLNLNGHTITCGGAGISIDGDNAHVSNGKIIANGGGDGVDIGSSYCLLNRLNITVASNSWVISIDHGNYNTVRNCMLSGPTGSGAFKLFLTSHNTIQNNTLAGTGTYTILEQDQAGTETVAGDNTFSGNQFANPTQ